MSKDSISISKNKRIAVTGALGALTILMGIPGLHLGFIQVNPTVSFTVMHIPVILAAFFAGLPGVLVTGAVFGITSLVNSAINPSGVLDPFFVNPLCSILPRLLFAAAAWGLFKFFDLLPSGFKILNPILMPFISSIFHTCAVIGSLYIFYGKKMTDAVGGLSFIALISLISVGALLEAISASVVCTAAASGFMLLKNKTPKLYNDIENKTEN